MKKIGKILFQRIRKPNPPIVFPDPSEQSTMKKLTSLAQQSERILLVIRSVFPFQLFPDEIILDETKLSVHHKLFFFSKQRLSVEYEDVFNVSVEHSMFFATIKIEDRYFVQRPIIVTYLRKQDAILARRVIQGMILAKRAGVDLQSVKHIHELLEVVERIGKAR